MKVYTNQTNFLEASTAVVNYKDKDQVAGLKLAESFILCGNQACNTYIKSIAMSIHRDDVACGKFTDKGSNVDMTRLESGMAFLQVNS